jgi:hypothetical protein
LNEFTEFGSFLWCAVMACAMSDRLRGCCGTRRRFGVAALVAVKRW